MAAFLPGNYVVGAIEFVELTLHRIIMLSMSGSPFWVGGRVSAGDIAHFLWITSPKFSTSETERNSFLGWAAKLDAVKALDSCHQYLDAMTADMPGGKGAPGASPVSWVASIVDALASQYGWRVWEIIEMPCRQIWQLLRCIRLRLDPNAIFINRADKLKQQWLDQRNAGVADG
jgi:hypothetical protein